MAALLVVGARDIASSAAASPAAAVEVAFLEFPSGQCAFVGADETAKLKIYVISMFKILCKFII
jgi:hypothetical protein